jgi:hypothetical protein
MIRMLFAAIVLTLTVSAAVVAQTEKPWTEWSEKDAAKILNDSPWGQTQTEKKEAPPSANEAISRNGSRMQGGMASTNGESGQAVPDTTVRFRARFLSAKPVRSAFARMVVLRRQTADEALVTELQGFINRDFADYVVVTLMVEAANDGLAVPAMHALKSATTDTLKEKVFLERKDGKRLTLADYRPPGPDGMGAKFIFMRKLDGQPFLTEASDNVKFQAELSEKMKLNLKYKVSEMMYDGRLEY